jgi:hypothetical protein
MYFIRHCFNAATQTALSQRMRGSNPRTVVTLAIRRSNHLPRFPPLKKKNLSPTILSMFSLLYQMPNVGYLISPTYALIFLVLTTTHQCCNVQHWYDASFHVLRKKKKNNLVTGMKPKRGQHAKPNPIKRNRDPIKISQTKIKLNQTNPDQTTYSQTPIRIRFKIRIFHSPQKKRSKSYLEQGYLNKQVRSKVNTVRTKYDYKS